MYNAVERLERYLSIITEGFSVNSAPYSYIQGQIDARNATGSINSEDNLTSSGHPITPNGYKLLTKSMLSELSSAYLWLKDWTEANPDKSDIDLTAFSEEEVMYSLSRYHMGYSGAEDELKWIFDGTPVPSPGGDTVTPP